MLCTKLCCTKMLCTKNRCAPKCCTPNYVWRTKMPCTLSHMTAVWCKNQVYPTFLLTSFSLSHLNMNWSNVCNLLSVSVIAPTFRYLCPRLLCPYICSQLLYLPTLCASFQSSTVCESGFPTEIHHCCVVRPVQTTEIHHCCLHWIVCSIEHVLRVSTLCSLSFSCEDTV